ncbi:hypothetical protein BJF85_20860 [Saccharomonospora sp. CUA-673]|uniref:ABC transporter transmembrane domain-containing protein n=1 Tax=Saccharomonospora sp. CUA-673 TaxID=1904969 RepID=UPI000959E3FA|nr:ABC transporter ATP-binding protein [Saccharomonospora sp. CUA-673]OLT43993.1 hypothetical protein BJF85_20860 [Saccharomonospora sp. CUA-673]
MCAGLGQAALAGVTAFTMPRLLSAVPGDRWTWLGVLVLAAVCMGGVRVVEWILAEKLSQDYVHQIRLGLLGAALGEGRGPSVGITIARTTNDLTAVRNWIAWGIAPLASGIPLILGVLVVLASLHPALTLAVVGPVVVLACVFAALARVAYMRARTVRRARGRLASQVADTVAAGSAIRAGGGVHRELGRLRKLSGRVQKTAIQRARVAGYLRGTAVSTAALATLGVVIVGAGAGLTHALVATTITIVGVLATPIHDLGRIVEYRQSYLAARRILAPELARATPSRASSRGGADGGEVRGAAEVHVHDLAVGGVRLPGLVAAPGARVVLRSESPERVAAVLDLLAGTGSEARGWVRVAGRDLGSLRPAARRRHVGYAARGLALERGTVARAVRYRNPESDLPVDRELEAVGLAERVRALPEGERTTLRRGGEPLAPPERARLQLARALYARPPLVVLDHIEDELGAGGAELVQRLLADYPGVVVLATDAPERLLPGEIGWDVWDLATDPAAEATPGRVIAAGFARPTSARSPLSRGGVG